MEKMSKKHHFILVHGLGQRAWCWNKIKTILQSLGHQVTALDLAASRTNLKKLSEVHTFLEYSKPLLEFMEAIPSEEKVVLVGHSLGGMNIAHAMEVFPGKVSAAVFLNEGYGSANKFTKEGYGSVNRAYIISMDDKIITDESQRWMITNNPGKEEYAIKGSDHFAMFSKPQEVCKALIEIANILS